MLFRSQPVQLAQTFVKVGTGKTQARADNGTPQTSADDKDGSYTLTGTEKVLVMAGPKAGETSLPTDAQTLLDAIKNATSVTAFGEAVSAAQAKMAVFFGANLGDTDITGDGVAEKGVMAGLAYVPSTAANATTITFGASGGGAAGIQPVQLAQTFVKVGTGKTQIGRAHV